MSTHSPETGPHQPEEPLHIRFGRYLLDRWKYHPDSPVTVEEVLAKFGKEPKIMRNLSDQYYKDSLSWNNRVVSLRNSWGSIEDFEESLRDLIAKFSGRHPGR